MTSIFKNRILVLCLATAASSCFIACHKDKDDAKKTKLEQLQQRWDLKIRYDTLYMSVFGPSDTTQYVGQPGDYYEFGKNDSLITSERGHVTTLYYKFNDTTMTLNNQFGSVLYNILDLTDSTLELYNKTNLNARGDEWVKNHIYLKR